MNGISYTYCVVRYLHDPATGEMLNVGVVLWAPSVRYLAARFEHRYERLSNTFVDFKGEHHKRSLRQFESALDKLSGDLVPTLLPPARLPETVAGFIGQIWPDEGLSFISGPVLAGITDDPDQAINEIFDRMVASQYLAHQTDKRTDEEVWAVYSRPLVQTLVHKRLRPWTLQTDEVTLKFDHAFKNDHWRVLQAVSLDYVKAETLQRKAMNMLGTAAAVEGHPELSKLYMLLGRPRIESHQRAYAKAKDILHKIKIDKQLVEEDEAEDFATNLRDYMKAHGLIEE